MAYLILVRHGESIWNALGKWTGWTDVALSEKGRDQAKQSGNMLKDLPIDLAYTSNLIRAKQTWEEIQNILNKADIPTVANEALNERDYGDFTGKNKWEIKVQVGDEEFQKIRRSWDYPPLHGESLKMVYQRVIPYYEDEILPKLEEGKNIIIVAHGNSLRALIKYLENIPDDKISELELPLGAPVIYKIDENGNVINKEIREIGTTAM